MTGPRGPTEEPLLDLRAVEARYPATVVLEAGEHHSQDVRERIQAHVDVTALLVHCRMLRAALEESSWVMEMRPPTPEQFREWDARRLAALKWDAAVLALACDEEAPGEAQPQPK